MKNSDDNDIKNLFGDLSEGEAPVSGNVWDKVSGNLPTPGFWQFGLSHFNIFYLAVPVLISVGTWFAVSDFETEEKQPIQTTTTVPVTETEKQTTESADIPQQTGNEEPERNDIVLSEEPAGEEKKSPVATESSEQQEESAPEKTETETETEKESEALHLTKDRLSVADSVQDETIQDTLNRIPEAVSEPVDEEKAPAGKKIIVFEEDTIIQVDTVYSDKKGKRSRR